MSVARRQLTNHDPELPKHDQSTTNASGSNLGRVYWNSSILRTNADAHDETSCEKFLPTGRKARGDWCGYQAASGNEDLTAPTEIVVERVDNESAAAQIMSANILVCPI